jgi:hypothetical protein
VRRREVLRALAALPLFAGRDLFAEGVALQGPGAPGGYLAKHELATAGAAADRILPATGTPGALAAGVDLFIDRWLTATGGEAACSFRVGLSSLNHAALSTAGTLFHHLPAADQDAALTAIAKTDPGFFEDLRGLTVFGYYTSKIGMEQELAFEMIPGEYAGCSHPEHQGKK